MNKDDLELVEIFVKPGESCDLAVINDVKRGLYKVLNQGENLCKVKKGSGDELQLDTSPSTWGVKEEDIHGVADIRRDSSVQFVDKRVDVSGHTEKKKVTGDGYYSYGQNFERYRLTNMDGVIELDNGNFLINMYGKYQPNLSFINNVPEVKFESESPVSFNLPKGSLSIIYGDFFTSKKGTKCFRILPKEKAKNILIRDNRGGAFDKYRGGTLPEDGSLYYRRASSNGGGSGYDYGIYEKNWKLSLNEDDI